LPEAGAFCAAGFAGAGGGGELFLFLSFGAWANAIAEIISKIARIAQFNRIFSCLLIKFIADS
jgi:hypothetical protein